MSTFNQSSNLGPQRIDRRDEVPQEPGEVRERPSPEKVSPSQQGKFLGELEKKEKKKETKEVAHDGDDEETVEGEKGLFGLAHKVKERKSLSEEGSGEEEGSEEGEEKPKQAAVPQVQAIPQGPQIQKPIEKTEDSAVGSVEELPKREEAKERVAFRTPSGQEKERSAAAQPPTMAPRPELVSQAKESTLEEAQAARESLIELFKQAVDALTTMVSKTQTNTVVTIRHPPIFDGASLVVTEYSSAKKEYNITFGNLSPEARRLLETLGSEQQLRQTLIDKGYTLHMMTIESRPFKVSPTGIETATAEEHRRERPFEQGGGEQKGRE